jgi:hypothetical protein
MTKLFYRTNATSLTESELTILDVIFDGGATLRLLYDDIFKPQWNLPYSHNLDDDALRVTVNSLCERGILLSDETEGETVFRMTPAGGDAWSRERCPVWERFFRAICPMRIRDCYIWTVTAVSPVIRDDFFHFWPKYPVRRKRTRIIADFGLLPWRSFDMLHAGVASVYDPHDAWTPEESAIRMEAEKKHRATLEANRSWWQSVDELQRFVGEAV